MKRNKLCKACGARYRDDLPEPIHCPCGSLIGSIQKLTQVPPQPAKVTLPERRVVCEPSPEAERKIAICRSNVCGHYAADHDACGILRDRGKAGAVTYLLTHPETKCVAPEPLF